MCHGVFKRSEKNSRPCPAGTGRTMYVHCMYGLGSHPVLKRNIRITYSLGSDRVSPNYQKSMCVRFWFTLGCTYGSVRTGPYVQGTYGSVRTMYVHVHTYIVRKRPRYGEYGKLPFFEKSG